MDTEFIERPQYLDLLSLALVAEDGRHMYRENAFANWDAAGDWVKENVLPQLAGPGSEIWATPDRIAKDVLAFVGADKPEFWGYYADYDWVAFCWLFGAMVDLPNGWPMYCRDLKQEADRLGITFPQPEQDEHHALVDASWNALMFHDFLSGKDGAYTAWDSQEGGES